MSDDDVVAQGDEEIALANERTFLAWIRTSLALTLTGVAIVTFDVPIAEALATAAAVAFIVLGVGAAAQAWIGWTMNQRALRDGRELPAPGLRVYLAAGVVLVAASVGIGLLVGI